MTDLTQFKREINIYTLLMAIAAELISLPFLGFDLLFSCGLAAGTAVTVFNFTLLVKAGEKVMEAKEAKPMVGGYFIRLVIYGVVFFAAIKVGVNAAIGCVSGFVTLHAAILVLYIVVYGLFKKKENPLNDWTEPKEWNDLSIYDDEDEDWKYTAKEE